MLLGARDFEDVDNLPPSVMKRLPRLKGHGRGGLGDQLAIPERAIWLGLSGCHEGQHNHQGNEA